MYRNLVPYVDLMMNSMLMLENNPDHQHEEMYSMLDDNVDDVDDTSSIYKTLINIRKEMKLIPRISNEYK